MRMERATPAANDDKVSRHVSYSSANANKHAPSMTRNPSHFQASKIYAAEHTPVLRRICSFSLTPYLKASQPQCETNSYLLGSIGKSRMTVGQILPASSDFTIW